MYIFGWHIISITDLCPHSPPPCLFPPSLGAVTCDSQTCTMLPWTLELGFISYSRLVSKLKNILIRDLNIILPIFRPYLIVWANLPVAWQRGHTCFMRTGQVTSPLFCFNRWLLNNWLDLGNSVRPFLLAFPLQIHITQTLSSSFFPVNTFVNRCKPFTS